MKENDYSFMLPIIVLRKYAYIYNRIIAFYWKTNTHFFKVCFFLFYSNDQKSIIYVNVYSYLNVNIKKYRLT